MSTGNQQYSYDELPYESSSFAQSHPDRLATLASLFGLSPVPITKCRVLELGCAGGGNLIPMAYHLPGSEFVGLDLSSRQVKMGQKTIQDLDLKNIRISQTNILDIEPSLGTFDYIIAHGVYSWVPIEVQERILEISSNHLTPNGVAYISYNTYPGWHMREMIRHMMLFHSNQFTDTRERIQQARALMDFLSDSVNTENSYYGMFLKSELELIKRSHDWYLFHDHLEEVNTPVYFHQFIESADRHGLQYLAEAEFSTMLAGGFSGKTAETLNRISQNIISSEQYMDFLRNRFFRQTLLCHKTHVLKRNLEGGDIKGLLVASSASPESSPVDFTAGRKQSFQTREGLNIETDFPLTKAALTILHEHWPEAIGLDTLFQEAVGRLQEFHADLKPDDMQDRKVLYDDLLHCYSSNLLELHTWQADFASELSSKPRVSDLARYLLEQKRPVVNLRHEIVNLDAMAEHVITCLDGTRDREQLLENIETLIEDGTISVSQDEDSVTDNNKIKEALAGTVEDVLQKLAASALLVY